MPIRPSEPRLEVSRGRFHTIARVAGCNRLTDENLESIGQELSSLAENGGGKHLLLDLEAVEYLDAVALGKLVGLNKRLRAVGGRLTVSNPRPAVREILAATRMDHLFDIVSPEGSILEGARHSA
jgi:anti-anti-sigma factor